MFNFVGDRHSEKIIAFDKKELQVRKSWKTETYFLFFRLCLQTYLVSKYFNYFSYNTTYITWFVRRIFGNLHGKDCEKMAFMEKVDSNFHSTFREWCKTFQHIFCLLFPSVTISSSGMADDMKTMEA